MDYYSILGVPKNADEKAIRKAYKKQSMQHHPDRGGNEEQFKKINEAYQTLKDPQKRAAYDNPQPQFRYNSTDFHQGNPFENMFGFGGQRSRQRRNRDVTIAVRITLKDALYGKQLVTRYQLQSGRIKDAEIDIPAGIDNGVGIRFEGLGDDTIPNLPNGDLIVRVRIDNEKNWRRDGNNLHTTIVVSIFDCLLGNKVQIKTLENRTLELNIPKGTQPTATFSIPGHGIPDMRTGVKGNMFVKLNTIVPKIEDPSILMDIERVKNALN
jgi:DnaJ-class molecular chaperone